MLTRRQLLLAPAAFRAAGAAPAADRGHMMWEWLLARLDAADSRRREHLAALRTPADLDRLRTHVRTSLLAAIGGWPERTPLNARRTGTLQRSGYVIEKIVFESRPQYYVTANLYRPERLASPRPAVIESCGHYMEGKAAPDYQKACAALATKGIIALVFDPMGQGERRMYPQVRGSNATAEHSIAGKPTYLVGRPLAHYRVWDAVRALDYLESRPDVDRTRLGMFGHSGGGMMTLLTAPLEPRLKAVMSCCAVSSFYHKTRGLLIADPEQIVPGIYPAGIDHPELIAATSHRAFLIGAVLEDFVPLAGTRRTYQEVRNLAQNVGIVETPGPHMLNPGLREACYGWMLKHLAGESGDTREPALPVEKVEDLRCTPTGRVMDLPGARSVFDINRDLARDLARHRQPADLHALLGLPEKIAPEPGILLTSNMVTEPRPKGAVSPLIILISPRRNPALAAALAQAGLSVMELDLRGWGETAPHMPDIKPDFAWEEMFAFRAIEMGRPLAGMRALDLLATVAGARRRGHPRIFVVGLEGAGIVALHAAALTETIAGVAAVRTLRSYAEVMEQPISREPVSNLVPGALLHYDLPQLAERIRPRPAAFLDEPDPRRILEALHLS